MFENPLIWSVLLLALGLAIIVIELFVPSGGVLGVAAAAALFGAIFMALRHENSTLGATVAVAEVVGISAAIVLGIKWWPNTAIGRRIVPNLPTEEEIMPDGQQVQMLKDLVGKIGIAKSLMLPSGAVSIEGRTFNALSEGLAIEAGSTVRVIEVRGNRVIVQPVDPITTSGPDDDARDPLDPLSRPIEDLGIEPLDDPLA